MRMLLGAVAVVGALATGGPVVVLSVGHADQGVQTTADDGPRKADREKADPDRAKADPDRAKDDRSLAKPADKLADGKPGYGPPPWASSHQDKKAAKKPAGDKAADGDRPGQAEGRKPNEHAAAMSALGRAHGEAMRAWAGCVGKKAAGADPVEACGDKPVPPGHQKHPAKHR